MGLAAREKRWAPVIAEACRKHGVPVVWGLAMAYAESLFEPGTIIHSGGDGKRGGAWGMFQMTLKTARGEGFAGEPESLLDPVTNCDIAMRFVAGLMRRHGDDLRDVASAYNSGKSFAKAPASTRLTHVPHVLEAARRYAARSDLLTMRVG